MARSEQLPLYKTAMELTVYLETVLCTLYKRRSQISRGYLLPIMGSGPLEIDGVGLFIYGIDELALIGILSNGFSEDCIEFLFEFR